MRKVLVIVNSEDLQVALRDALSADWDVTVCGDAAVGTALIRQGFDTLVLDLFLPGIDGLTFLKIAEAYLPAHIVALTTLVNQHILRVLSDLGVGCVLLKPCSVSRIVQYLEETQR